MILMFIRRAVPAAAALVLLAGCAAAPDDGAAGRVRVLAAVYPLEYVVEQVGGEHVEVATLTPAGTDPHAVELSPRQLRDVGAADLVVHLGGFQAAVDDAVAERAADRSLDVADAADLRPAARDDHADDDADHADADRADADHADADRDDADDAHGHLGLDPHFWLDPERLAAVGHAVADALARTDPGHAEEYAAGADALAADLAALDEEYRAGLADCAADVVVTSHAAFGYLTDRYGLRQVSVSGLEPEGEPSPARIREVREVVAGLAVDAVFTEPLADPAVAATLAEGLGVAVLTLDPLDSHDGGPGYREVMTANLAALRDGLGCR
jgi:zinc transport system substrate-binding protein